MKIQTTLIFFFLSSFLFAQDVLLFEDTKTETLVFSSSHNNGAPIYQILRHLAPQQNHRTSFDLHYQYNCRLVEKPNVLFTELRFEALEVHRAPRLHGFEFSDLLLPPSATLTIDLLANNEKVHSICQTVSLNNLNQASIRFNYADIQPSTVYTLVVKDLQFNYGNPQVQAVDKRIDAIKQYHLATDDLQTIRQNITSLEGNQPDPDQIHVLENNVNAAVTQFNKIDNAPFWHILHLQGNNSHDPANLLSLRDDTRNDLNHVQTYISNIKARIHELYYEKGITLFEQKRISDAKNAFQKSINAANDYAPSHYFLAHIDFHDGHIKPSADRIIKVLNRFNPDPTTRQNSEELARRIIGFHFAEGQRAVDAGHYAEGVDIYRHAQAFGQSIRGFHFGQNEAESRIREAYHLDLHHRLDDVVYLHRQGNHQQALAQMEDALAFQADFNIPTNFDTYNLHKNIVQAIFGNQLNQIEQLAQNQYWDKAIDELGDSRRFLDKYRSFISDDKAWLSLSKQVYEGKHKTLYLLAEDSRNEGRLDKALEQAQQALTFATSKQLSEALIYDSNAQVEKIQRARYQRFVLGGNKARQNQQFATALQQYEAASELEKQLPYLATSIELEQKLKGTALQEIKRLHQTVMRQDGHNNEKIASTFTSIQQLSGRYYLTLEPEVKSIYRDLENQQCANASQILLPKLEQELAAVQRSNDYIRAQEVMGELKTLLASYPDCRLNDQVVREQETTIAICADYQRALVSAKSAERSRRYRTALDHYQQAKELYQNTMVSSRLSGHPAFNTYEYVLGHQQDNMVMAGANLYLDKREHEASLSLLKSLIARGIPPKRTESLQERLGSALAVRDYSPSANWKVSFYAYISKHERKSYRDLQRSFRKQWNRMG